MEALLYDYYGWDPYWGATHFGAAALPNAEARIVGDAARRNAEAEIPPVDGGDHLHSAIEFKGYTVHALDGDIGHVENVLADDANWEIRYLVIATRNWWPGKIVQLAPYAVKDIDWFGQHINMNVTPRSGEVGTRLGPAGAGGRGPRGRASPPFRLAGLWPAVGEVRNRRATDAYENGSRTSSDSNFRKSRSFV